MKKNKIDWETVLGSQKDFNDFDFEHKLTLMDYLDIYVLYPLRDFNYEVKMKYQILTRGYSDRMVYGFCDYMTDLKLQLLKELKKNKQGHPLDLLERSGMLSLVKSLKDLRHRLHYGMSLLLKNITS